MAFRGGLPSRFWMSKLRSSTVRSVSTARRLNASMARCSAVCPLLSRTLTPMSDLVSIRHCIASILSCKTAVMRGVLPSTSIVARLITGRRRTTSLRSHVMCRCWHSAWSGMIDRLNGLSEIILVKVLRLPVSMAHDTTSLLTPRPGAESSASRYRCSRRTRRTSEDNTSASLTTSAPCCTKTRTISGFEINMSLGIMDVTATNTMSLCSLPRTLKTSGILRYAKCFRASMDSFCSRMCRATRSSTGVNLSPHVVRRCRNAYQATWRAESSRSDEVARRIAVPSAYSRQTGIRQVTVSAVRNMFTFLESGRDKTSSRMPNKSRDATWQKRFDTIGASLRSISEVNESVNHCSTYGPVSTRTCRSTTKYGSATANHERDINAKGSNANGDSVSFSTTITLTSGGNMSTVLLVPARQALAAHASSMASSILDAMVG